MDHSMWFHRPFNFNE
ncbi:hypothetical protein, partial [Salmonella enterica]